MIKIRVCEWCGKELKASSKDKRFCSNNCAHRVRYWAKASARLIDCLVCGKKFYPTHGLRNTCSDECRLERNKWRALRYQQERVRNRLRSITCAYCAIEFTTTNARQKCCCRNHSKALYKKMKKSTAND